MTLEQIKALSDRELDALILEHIFEWRWRTRQSDNTSWLVPAYQDNEGDYLHGVVGHFSKDEIPGARRFKRGAMSREFCFSTDPAASKALRDQLVKSGLWVDMVRRADGTTWCWVHEDGDERNPNTVPAVSAATEERCIAEAAALATLGGGE